MSTLMQKGLAEKVLQNPKLMRKGSKGKLVEMGGYSKPMQEHPKRVLESKGFKEELAKFGLTEELVTTALVFDIEAKPKKRVRELELGADILSMRKREDAGGNKIQIINIMAEAAQKYGIEATNSSTISNNK